MHNAHTPLSESEQDIPACCQAIVDKLLAKDPSERYDSAAELSTALTACMDELPSSTPAESSDESQSRDAEPEPGPGPETDPDPEPAN